MASQLRKIKEVILNDKRLCERLVLPIKIRYARTSGGRQQETKWSEVTHLDNIGGEGFGFFEDVALSEGERLHIELALPCDTDPFIFGASVVRVEDGAGAEQGRFFCGVQITDLQEGSKQKFEEFISDSIIDKYIDDQGNLKDIEG